MKIILKRNLWVVGLLLIGLGGYLHADVRGDRLGVFVAFLGVACIIANLALGFERKRRNEYLRSVKYGTNALVATLLLIAALLLVNVISGRHSRRWDLTSAKLYTIRVESKEVLAHLKKPVEIIGFHRANNQRIRADFEQVMDQYVDAAPSGLLTFRLVDPDQNPEIAQQFDDSVTYGTIAIQGPRGVAFTDSFAEEKIINAIIILSREKDRVVCFLKGHGEKDIDNRNDPFGFGSAKEITEATSYRVRSVNLLRVGDIPSECDLMIMAGPQEPYEPKSMDILMRYLDRGGRAAFLLDPDFRGRLGLESFALRFNLQLGDDVVLDNLNRMEGGNPAFPLVDKYPPPPTDPKSPWNLTQDLNLPSFFPLAQSFKQMSSPMDEEVNLWPFLTTSSDSYGEVDLLPYIQGQTPEKGPHDHRGPMTIGFAAQKVLEIDGKPIEQRVVFIGDSDFAGNQVSHGGNAQLFANVLKWTTRDEDLINFDLFKPKPHLLSLSARDERMIRIATVYFFPGVFLLAGLIIYYARRRL